MTLLKFILTTDFDLDKTRPPAGRSDPIRFSYSFASRLDERHLLSNWGWNLATTNSFNAYSTPRKPIAIYISVAAARCVVQGVDNGALETVPTQVLPALVNRSRIRLSAQW